MLNLPNPSTGPPYAVHSIETQAPIRLCGHGPIAWHFWDAEKYGQTWIFPENYVRGCLARTALDSSSVAGHIARLGLFRL